MMSVPSQKVGSESPIKPPIRAAKSRRERGRTDETKPRGMPSAIAMSAAAAASSRVAGRRSAISTSTGRPVRIEYPASPWRSEVTQVQYWTRSGWSRPKYARRLASCSGVRAVDVPRRAAIASPGMSRMNRNVSSETPTSVGMAPSSRCARYRLTPRAATASYLLVEPGLPKVDDRAGWKVREPLRGGQGRDVVAADEEPDERDTVDELLLRGGVEVLALRRVGRCPCLLDRVA